VLSSSTRLGLCCGFVDVAITFRRATARYASGLSETQRIEYLQTIARDNSEALLQAIRFCAEQGIGAFRINSQIFPLYTHPVLGYAFDAIDAQGAIRNTLGTVKQEASDAHIRLSFHPDQFVVPGSTRQEVVADSLRELEYQALVSAFVGAEPLTLHGGGAQGGKPVQR